MSLEKIYQELDSLLSENFYNNRYSKSKFDTIVKRILKSSSSKRLKVLAIQKNNENLRIDHLHSYDGKPNYANISSSFSIIRDLLWEVENELLS